MDRIDLIELLKIADINIDEDYGDVYIVAVEYFEKSNVIKLFLESDLLLGNNFIGMVRDHFFEKFNVDRVEIETIYKNIKFLEDVFDSYKESLYSEIGRVMPSCSSWLEHLKIGVEKNDVTLSSKKQFVCDIIESNGFVDDIKNIIKRDLGLIIKVDLDKTCVEIEDEFIDRQEKEEAEISKVMVLENPVEVKNNAGSKNKAVFDRNYSIGKKILQEPMEMGDINSEIGFVTVEGEVFSLETKEIKGGKVIVEMDITDMTGSITVKTFLTNKKYEEFSVNIQKGSFIKVSGDVSYDSFSRCTVIMIDLCVWEKKQKAERIYQKRKG